MASTDPLTFSDLEPMVENVVRAVLGLAGITLFILIVLGGFQLITSGGDPGKVQAAWKTITFAIGGLVVILLSILILRFIYVFTGVNVLEFKIVN